MGHYRAEMCCQTCGGIPCECPCEGCGKTRYAACVCPCKYCGAERGPFIDHHCSAFYKEVSEKLAKLRAERDKK